MRTYDLRAGQLFREHIDGTCARAAHFYALGRSNSHDSAAEPVVSVAHSPDARFLLAGCLDGSIRLIEKPKEQKSRGKFGCAKFLGRALFSHIRPGLIATVGIASKTTKSNVASQAMGRT